MQYTDGYTENIYSFANNIDTHEYISKSEKFFEIYDINNCKRTYDAICNI